MLRLKIRKPYQYITAEYTIENDPYTFTEQVKTVTKQEFIFTTKGNNIYTFENKYTQETKKKELGVASIDLETGVITAREISSANSSDNIRTFTPRRYDTNGRVISYNVLYQGYLDSSGSGLQFIGNFIVDLLDNKDKKKHLLSN